jgi:pilus assembly protein CpaC
VGVGKSIIIDIRRPVKRVSLADPAVADALVLTPKQIYVTGKAPGVTNLTLWDTEENICRIFDLEAVPDINRLKEKLHEIFPKEENIRITATHDSLGLYGTVSSAASLAEIVSLAQAYAPREKGGEARINNFLEVEGVQQVMLEVQISEMSRGLIKSLGINFNAMSKDGSKFGVSLLDGLSVMKSLSAAESFGGKSLELSDKLNAIFRFYHNEVPWTVLVDALKGQGVIKVLAEPTLITLSGKPANFLAGGEFPIPVPQEGSTTIEYKQLGVGLQFTPTVLSSGKINMEVAPEVSELDFANGISMNGFKIPALSTRRVATVIELGDGQSFAVAGLLKDSVTESVRKFPLLGDIPVLGALFRSSAFQKNETELVVIVTPHLVKPLDKAKQTLPTDEYKEPDDLEFYFQGKLEGRGEEPLASPSDSPSAPSHDGGGAVPYGKELEGDFGLIQQ